jgi:hypothetical protein
LGVNVWDAERVVPKVRNMVDLIESTISKASLLREDLDPILQKSVEEATLRIEEAMQQSLVSANVSTPSQLYKKQKALASSMQIAEKIFIQTGSLRLLQVKADETVVMSAFGKLSDQHKTIISTYWDYISKTEKGLEIHCQIGKQLGEKFFQLSSIITDLSLSMEKFDLKLSKMANVYVEQLTQSAQKTYNSLLQQRAGCTDRETQIQLDYLLLQYELMGKSFLNYMIQQALEPLVRRAERNFNNADTARLFLRGDLENAEISLEACEKRFKSDQETKADCILRNDVECLRVMDYVKTPEEHAIEMSKMEEERAVFRGLIGKTREYLSQYFYARSEAPEAIAGCIPLLTQHDKAVIQLLQVDGGMLHLELKEITPNSCVAEIRRKVEEKTELFRQVVEGVSRVV